MNDTSSRPGQKRLRSIGVAIASSAGIASSIVNQPCGSDAAISCRGSFALRFCLAAMRSSIAFASHGRSFAIPAAVASASRSVEGEGRPEPSSSRTSVNSAANALAATLFSTSRRPSTTDPSRSLSAPPSDAITALRISRDPMSRRSAGSSTATRSAGSSRHAVSTACTRTPSSASSIARDRSDASITLSKPRSATRSACVRTTALGEVNACSTISRSAAPQPCNAQSRSSTTAISSSLAALEVPAPKSARRSSTARASRCSTMRWRASERTGFSGCASSETSSSGVAVEIFGAASRGASFGTMRQMRPWSSGCSSLRASTCLRRKVVMKLRCWITPRYMSAR